MDNARIVLKEYIKSLCICKSENINERVLFLAELVTFHFRTKSEKTRFFQDGFPKLKKLEIVLDKFDR